jgi:hypothetical protein
MSLRHYDQRYEILLQETGSKNIFRTNIGCSCFVFLGSYFDPGLLQMFVLASDL